MPQRSADLATAVNTIEDAARSDALGAVEVMRVVGHGLWHGLSELADAVHMGGHTTPGVCGFVVVLMRLNGHWCTVRFAHFGEFTVLRECTALFTVLREF